MPRPDDDTWLPPIGSSHRESPEEIEALWADALPRAEAAMTRARVLGPTLVGLSTSEAGELVARDPELRLRFLAPRQRVSLRGVYGRINAVVVDDRVTRTFTG